MPSISAHAIPVSALPIIDMAGLRSSNRADSRRAVANAIGAACRDKGFFYIRNHGVAPKLIEAVARETRRFFALPADLKATLVKDEASYSAGGYEPFGVQTLEPGTAPDIKEAFDIGVELPEDHPFAAIRKLEHGSNHWPSVLPAFRTIMEEYFEIMLGLSTLLLDGIGQSLGLPDDYFQAFCHEPISLLRLLHYPQQPAQQSAGEIGAGARTDWGALTILLQDDNAGLQVWDRDTGWILFPPLPNAYVVNLGDLMARWTNDHYRSTLHRVVNLSGRERYSVPFFLDGDPDYVVSCLPNCSGPDDPAKYPPITTVDHVREMSPRR